MNRIQKIRANRAEARKRALDEAFNALYSRVASLGVTLKPFGSFAEGEVHAGSDLDLMIAGSDLSSETRRAVIRASEMIAEEAGVRIDLVFEAESPRFYREVKDAHPV